MISAISAGQTTKNNLNTLSYINEIITGATAQGLNVAFVKQQLLNNEMISILKNTYGYKVDIPNNTLKLSSQFFKLIPFLAYSCS